MPTTRSMSRRGAAAEPAPSLTSLLSEDEARAMVTSIASPLEPQPVLRFAATCHFIHTAVAGEVGRLREEHLAVRALCRKIGTSCAAARRAELRLLIGVMSTAGRGAHRDAIRRSWMRWPGATTWRAMRSQSTTGMPCWAVSKAVTVDLPEAMPPVSPTRRIVVRAQEILICKWTS